MDEIITKAVSAPWHLYLMASLYMMAGAMHFIKPRVYLAIIPPFLPFPGLLVQASGMLEIALGVAVCFRRTQEWAVYGILIMLCLFLTVHFHMLTNKKASLGLPRWLLLARIPLQFLLMYWASTYIFQ